MELEQKVMSRPEAERLTERIRHAATSFVEAREKLTQFIQEAQEGQAHVALGFRSWTEYVSQVFSDTPLMRLTRDERRELVGELAEQGMSTRAIAPIVGASQMTVVRDVEASESNVSDAPRTVQSTDGITRTFQPRPATPAPFDQEADLPTPASEVGTDRPRKRKALTDQAAALGWEIRKDADKLTAILSDDRYARNKEEVTAHLRGHLEHMVAACHAALDA